MCAVVLGALLAPGAAATPPPSSHSGDRFPDLIAGHDRPTHGRAALELLADRLPEAARRNGMTAERLRGILTHDPSAWLDADARLYYQEPARTEGAAAASIADTAAPAPLSQTFLLHSKPGSRHTIYLDFDGQYVSGTVWNSPNHGLAPGLHPAWSLDSNRSSFSSTEREVVQNVWQRVSEDFAPFDVDVTTQDPGSAAIARGSSGDLDYGTRALISPSTNAPTRLCGGSCGGIAYIGVFDEVSPNADSQPAWIFPQFLGNDTKSIAEAVSHEVGHNFGLTHDGVSGGTSYYGGHGTWAPIMGTGYSRPITQWSRGDYSGANNSQDDLGVISSGGAPLLPDEAPSAPDPATRLLAGTAYITSRTDIDVFALGICSGQVTVDAVPAPSSPDLDLQLRLLKSNGSAVAANNPPSSAGTPARDKARGMDAAIDQALTESAYYVEVDGVGNGTASSGYNDYASLGAYTLELTGSCSDPRGVPSAPQSVTASAGSHGASVTLRWAEPASPGTSAITNYVVSRTGAAPVTVTGLSHTFPELAPGTGFAFTVAAVNTAGAGAMATTSAATPNRPGAAGSVRGTSGRSGGRVTAIARWRPPASDGGARVNGYRVYGYRLNSRGQVVQQVRSSIRPSSARTWQPRLHRGRWKFAVRARNGVGWGPISTRSRAVTAR